MYQHNKEIEKKIFFFYYLFSYRYNNNTCLQKKKIFLFICWLPVREREREKNFVRETIKLKVYQRVRKKKNFF